jgi:hypothetical protein
MSSAPLKAQPRGAQKLEICRNKQGVSTEVSAEVAAMVRCDAQQFASPHVGKASPHVGGD